MQARGLFIADLLGDSGTVERRTVQPNAHHHPPEEFVNENKLHVAGRVNDVVRRSLRESLQSQTFKKLSECIFIDSLA